MPSIYKKKHPEQCHLGRPTNVDRDRRLMQQQALLQAQAQTYAILPCLPSRTGTEKLDDQSRANNKLLFDAGRDFSSTNDYLAGSNYHGLVLDEEDTNRQRLIVPSSNQTIYLDSAKDATVKIYKSVFSCDLRQIYSSMMLNAFNTSDLDHLQQVLQRVTSEDFLALRSQVTRNDESRFVLGSTYQLVSKSPQRFYNYFYDLAETIPDAAFYPHTFQMFKISHVPVSFSGIPIDLFQNKHLLNEHLLSIARRDGIEPREGYIIHGNHTFSGTSVFNIEVKNNNPEETMLIPIVNSMDTLRSSFFSNIRFDSTYIMVINDEGKVSRLETYAHINDKTKLDANGFYHPLARFTYDM